MADHPTQESRLADAPVGVDKTGGEQSLLFAEPEEVQGNLFEETPSVRPAEPRSFEASGDRDLASEAAEAEMTGEDARLGDERRGGRSVETP